MSGLLNFMCPDVILWWFPALERAFEKIKKNEVFNDRGTEEKCRFGTFHNFADFAAKWVNYYILGVLMSYYNDFLPWIEEFDDRGPEEKCRFGTFHNFADFAATE